MRLNFLAFLPVLTAGLLFHFCLAAQNPTITRSLPIKADEFEFASSGSGDFKGEFDVKDLDIAISGSSDMTQ